MLYLLFIFFVNHLLPMLGNLAVELISAFGACFIVLIGIAMMLGSKVDKMSDTIFENIFKGIGYILKNIFELIKWILKKMVEIIPIVYNKSKQGFHRMGMKPVTSNVLALIVTIVFILIVI